MIWYSNSGNVRWSTVLKNFVSIALRPIPASIWGSSALSIVIGVFYWPTFILGIAAGTFGIFTGFVALLVRVEPYYRSPREKWIDQLVAVFFIILYGILLSVNIALLWASLV